MGISRDEAFRHATNVGEITATAAGNQDLVANTLRTFHHDDAPAAPPGFGRTEQPRSTCSQNNHVKAPNHSPAFTKQKRHYGRFATRI